MITAAYGAGLYDTIIADGWDGQAPVTTISLVLTADGTRISSGHFGLWGDLAGAAVDIPACKLWEGVPKGTTLSIRQLRGEKFTFPGGQLHSAFADQAVFDVAYSRAGQPIMPQDWAENNIDQLSLRAVCYLDRTSNKRNNPKIKFTVLAAPLSTDAMTRLSGSTQHVTWPGIKILEGTADLFPGAPPGEWAAPVYPFLCAKDRSAAATAADKIPPAEHILFALAELMRSAALPTACTSRAVMNEKGQEILDSGVDPELRGPTITWPPATMPAPDLGNNLH